MNIEHNQYFVHVLVLQDDDRKEAEDFVEFLNNAVSPYHGELSLLKSSPSQFNLSLNSDLNFIQRAALIHPDSVYSFK